MRKFKAMAVAAALAAVATGCGPAWPAPKGPVGTVVYAGPEGVCGPQYWLTIDDVQVRPCQALEQEVVDVFVTAPVPGQDDCWYPAPTITASATQGDTEVVLTPAPGQIDAELVFGRYYEMPFDVNDGPITITVSSVSAPDTAQCSVPD